MNMDDSPAAQLKREREQARSLVGEGYARELIDQDELDQRLDAIERAGSIPELYRITADLRSPTPPSDGTLAVAHTGDLALVPSPPQKINAFLSSIERAGIWALGQVNEVQVVLGNAELDLRHATLAARTTVIRVQVWLGNLEIIVPPGYRVENHCHVVLGSFAEEAKFRHPAPSDGPVLRIEGQVVLGHVEIRERLPGEGKIAAWYRRRKEAKQLARARDKALPPGR